MIDHALTQALQSNPHTLSSAWLYDHRGSELFEAITALPSYYPTRTEAAIFERDLTDMLKTIPPEALVVELGSGASKKTRALLHALRSPAGYVPMDISAAFLHDAVASLAEEFPHLPIIPLVADFTTAFDLPDNLPAHQSRLGFFPGSTIGNLTAAAAKTLLVHLRDVLGQNGQLLIGIDLDKSADILIPAYADPEGVTAAFNRNLITRINRELGLQLDPMAFAHEARYYSDPARIEMHLVAQTPQTFALASGTYHLAAGDSLHTETSHKYTIEGFAGLAEASGWTLNQHWLDDAGYFAVLRLAAVDSL